MTTPRITVTQAPGSKRAFRITGKRFHFTPDQRRLLSGLLGRDSHQAEKYLKAIEWRMDLYLASLDIARIAPVPAPSEARKKVRRLNRLAARLYELLHEADLAGETRLLRCTQLALERRLGAPEALEKALRAFLPVSEAASAAPNRGGRRPNQREYNLILGLALSYRDHFGKLPPTGRESSFNSFFYELLNQIAAGDAVESADRYRLICRAVDTIRSTPARVALLKTPSE